jgi:hypothetical protein
MGGVESKFKEFAANNSYLKDYERYEIIGSKILVRLFFYKQEQKSGILGLDGKPIEDQDFKIKLYPYGKVLKMGTNVTEGYNHLQPGDMVHVADELTNVSINPAWLEWMEHRDERPKIKTQQPNMFVGNITQWKQYILIADKFKEEQKDEDMFTFAVPQTFILGKLDV